MAAMAHSPHLFRARCWLLGKLEKFHCVSKYATLKRKVARFPLCVWINIRKLSPTHSGSSVRREPFSHFPPSRRASPKNSHFASIKFPFTIDCWKWCPRIMLLMVTMLSSCAMMATVKRDIRDIQWNLSQSSIFLGIVALVSHPQWQPLNSVNRWATCPHSLLRYPIALLLSSRLFYCLPSQHTLDAYSNATTMASFKS